MTVKYKGEIDLVTEADHASEALILDRIRSAYPDCAILAEESGASEDTSPYVWIADPLDMPSAAVLKLIIVREI